MSEPEVLKRVTMGTAFNDLGEAVEPVKLVTASSDRELAADLRKRLEVALDPVIEIMDEATRSGLMLNFSLGRDGFGRSRVSDIQIVRPY